MVLKTFGITYRLVF